MITAEELDESLERVMHISRKQLDESLERVMNNVLLEMKRRSEHSDVQFAAVRGDIADIRARLDRQAGLIQSGGRAFGSCQFARNPLDAS
jgi:hypothetical protein